MPLEATIICLDGSEYMRNGDYIPNRLESMKDAASLLCRIKIDMNPESTVGVVASTTASSIGPKVLCSCSQDMAALLSACANLSLNNVLQNNITTNKDCLEFAKVLQVSALALKHRRNKNGGQRIVAFVGSPILDEEAKLIKLAKNLKKNNIAVDVVAMGENENNESKLKAFIEAVDKNSNSHLVPIPAGVLPSEVLMSSPIITGGEDGGDASMGAGAGGGGGGAAAQAFAEYGGVDPSLDPELAMALRASLEEERARMATSSTAPAAEPSSSAVPEVTPTKEALSQSPTLAEEDEEEMLRQALLMSMNDNPEETTAPDASSSTKAEDVQADEEDEDAKALALALAMSQEQETTQATTQAAPTAVPNPAPGAAGAQFLDPSYVNELLEGIEGVNMDDPQIQALLAQYPPSTDGKPPSETPDAKKQKKGDDDK